MTEPPVRETELPLNPLATDYERAGRALHLAVIDDIAARIRTLYPDAGHLEVTIDPETDDLQLHAIWSAQPTGQASGHLLLDLEQGTADGWVDHPFDLHQLVYDLECTLASDYPQGWGLVDAHPNYEQRERRWITLPPADRARHVAELIRAHVPDAEGLLCAFFDYGPAYSVALASVLHSDGTHHDLPCASCDPLATRRPWPDDVSHTIARTLSQLYALPHLRARDLRRHDQGDDGIVRHLLRFPARDTV